MNVMIGIAVIGLAMLIGRTWSRAIERKRLTRLRSQQLEEAKETTIRNIAAASQRAQEAMRQAALRGWPR